MILRDIILKNIILRDIILRDIIIILLIVVILFILVNIFSYECFESDTFKSKYIDLTTLTSENINNMYNDIFNNIDNFQKKIITDPKTNCVNKMIYKGNLINLKLDDSIKLQLLINNTVINITPKNNPYSNDTIIQLNRIYYILLEIALYNIYYNMTSLKDDIYISITNIRKSTRNSLNKMIDPSYIGIFDIDLLTVLINKFYEDTKLLMNDSNKNIYPLCSLSASFIDSFILLDINICNLSTLNRCLKHFKNKLNFLNISSLELLNNKLKNATNMAGNKDLMECQTTINEIMDIYKNSKDKIVLTVDGSVDYVKK